MTLNLILPYFQNCFLLIIPIFIWNLIFYKSLPPAYQKDIFWHDIPSYISKAENCLRIVVFILPLFMKFSLSMPQQRLGLIIYIAGTLIYFIAWIMQLYFPETAWCKSRLGFTALGFTTISWFFGIGLIGNSLLINIPYHFLIYFAVASAFVIFHTLHTYIVHSRL